MTIYMRESDKYLWQGWNLLKTQQQQQIKKEDVIGVFIYLQTAFDPQPSDANKLTYLLLFETELCIEQRGHDYFSSSSSSKCTNTHTLPCISAFANNAEVGILDAR